MSIESKIKDIKLMNSQCPYVVNDDIDVSYRDLPFEEHKKLLK